MNWIFTDSISKAETVRRKHSEWKKFKFKSKKAENIQSILGMHFWNI